MVLIDSSAWIEYLRRPREAVGRAVYRLLEDRDAAIVGVVLAEVLRGARNEEDFARLDHGLAAAEFVEFTRQAWVSTGQLAMRMKLAGTPFTLTDLAIAAIALEGDHDVFTLDQDFERIPGLRLYNWRDENA